MQQLVLGGKRVSMLPQVAAFARGTVHASAGDRPNPAGNKRSRHGFPASKPERHCLAGSGSSSGTLAAAAASMALEEASALGGEEEEEEERPASMLSRFRALVLDSSYRPIDVVGWQRAILMDLLEKADVLEYYDETVSSVRAQFFLPAVLRARWFKGGARTRVALNRRNIMTRDGFSCQYCGNGERDLTLDHVVPTSKGGCNTWENLVTACSTCNAKKGSKSLKELRWKLRAEPREPSPYELSSVVTLALEAAPRVPPEWQAYVLPEPEHIVRRRSKRAGGL